jgi:UDP-N-acetyl-D-galactosamine dehydrogenase
MALPKLQDVKIGVVGLGYVGLPLAAYLARHFSVLGFDIDETRISELTRGVDRTRELAKDELDQAKHLSFSASTADLKESNFYIITVPTPIDGANRPDLTALKSASRTVGRLLGRGDVVVYESTVYPGATEEICIPILAEASGLTFNEEFFAGYSPERINPGDHAHRLPDITKVTSGSTPEAAALIDQVYKKAVSVAGTYPASSIRVAEAAKVIENIQRDVNIALVNELAMLFKKLGLESREVFDAAATKWNFQPFRPGLVGGHCIGVDPYYLTHKAESIGFHPQMVLAGRRINDGMASYVVGDLIKTLIKNGQHVAGARVLVLGFTFKENCPDIRNTKVADVVKELRELVGTVEVYDPLAEPQEAQHEYGLTISKTLPTGRFDAIVLAVKHDQISSLGEKKLRALLNDRGVIYDIKNILPIDASDARL